MELVNAPIGSLASLVEYFFDDLLEAIFDLTPAWMAA
jgi:hypothetical protein